MWILWLLACADPAPPDPPAEQVDEVDVLLALGYVDHAEEVDESGRSGVEVLDAARVQPGLRLVVSAEDCEADLLTHEGELVRRYGFDDCIGFSNAELLPDGSLLVPMRNRGGKKKGPRRTVDKAFSLLWLEPDGTVRRHLDERVHHDVEVQPDGALWTTVVHKRRLPAFDEQRPVLDEDLLAMSAKGEEIWRFSLYDLLQDDPRVSLRRTMPGSDEANMPFVEVFHLNGIERMAEVAEGPLYSAENVLLTSRKQDALYIVDTVERALVYTWGPGILEGPHDPHLLESGNLLVFDNGRPPRTSRVLELDPRTDSIVWRYEPTGEHAFFTEGRGSAQRLPNGNTLIADSNHGEAREVTPGGTIVWRYANPRLTEQGQRHAIVRMRHYPADYLD